jgi:hypothetical protein
MYWQLEPRRRQKVSASFQGAGEIIHAGQHNKPGSPPRTKSNQQSPPSRSVGTQSSTGWCVPGLPENLPIETYHRKGNIRPMFKAEQIRELLTAKDFKPFVIHLSDGAHYEITNHDMVLVGRNDIHIGIGVDQVGIAERFVRCAIMHITRIEDLQAA